MAEVITAKIDQIPDAESFISVEKPEPQENTNGFSVEQTQDTEEE